MDTVLKLHKEHINRVYSICLFDVKARELQKEVLKVCESAIEFRQLLRTFVATSEMEDDEEMDDSERGSKDKVGSLNATSPDFPKKIKECTEEF